MDVRERMGRWVANLRLIRGALPWVAGAVGAKLGCQTAGLEPIDLNPLLSGLVAANVFLLGFLLAGTLSDFKESERLPADVAAGLEAIADECLILRDAKGEPLADETIERLRVLAARIREWLHGSASHTQVLAALRDLNAPLLALEGTIQATFVNRLKAEQSQLRRLLIRMATIRRTSFVAAGYAIAELTAALVVLALVLSDLGPAGEAAFFVGVITLLFVYMIALIRDLDNPFEYRNGRPGPADVSIAPIEEAERRLAAFLEADAPRAGALPEPQPV